MNLLDKVSDYYSSLNESGRSLFWLGALGFGAFEALALSAYNQNVQDSEYIALIGVACLPHVLFGYLFSEFRKSEFDLLRDRLN